MNLYQFLATVITGLAWPSLALIVIILFSRRAPNLLRFIKTIRYGDVEVTLQDARKDVEALELKMPSAANTALDPDDKVLRLAEIDTAVAVIEIWRRLEAKVLELVQHNGLVRFSRPEAFVLGLRELGKISHREYDLYRRLREIRNQAVHSRLSNSLTIAEVIEFRDFVDLFCARLDEIKNEPGYIDPAE